MEQSPSGGGFRTCVCGQREALFGEAGRSGEIGLPLQRLWPVSGLDRLFSVLGLVFSL